MRIRRNKALVEPVYKNTPTRLAMVLRFILNSLIVVTVATDVLADSIVTNSCQIQLDAWAFSNLNASSLRDELRKKNFRLLHTSHSKFGLAFEVLGGDKYRISQLAYCDRQDCISPCAMLEIWEGHFNDMPNCQEDKDAKDAALKKIDAMATQQN